LLDDDRKRPKQRFLKLGHHLRIARAHKPAGSQLAPNVRNQHAPHEGRHALEAILIKVGVARVLADRAENVDQLGEHGQKVGRQGLARGDDHAHDT
jgi:hypothetical protein